MPATSKEQRTIRRFRRRWKVLASFANLGPPKRHMSVVLFRLGNLYADILFMGNNLKGFNDMRNCIFVAVELGSQLMFAHPMLDKSSESCMAAIRRMLEVSAFEAPHTIFR